MNRGRSAALAAFGACAAALLLAARGDRTLNGLASDTLNSLPAAPTFEGAVLPLLQRQGCSSAYCHGGATGKGGLKLSLFGGDADADWRALAVDQDGRRLDLREPERSLVLQKPSLTVPHGGGERLPRDGAGFATLRAWIAAGAGRGPQAGVRALALERRGDALHASASLTDGDSREVTDLAVFQSSDPRVGNVTAEGHLAMVGAGEAFVTARYAGADAVLRVLQPLPAAAAATAPAVPEPATGLVAEHPLDRAARQHLATLGLRAAAAAPQHVLVRRLHLDLAGRTPTVPELTALLALPPQQLAAHAAATLTAGDDFVTVFAGHLADWLEVPDAATTPRGQEPRTAQLRARLHAAVQHNQPLGQLARELLQAGSPLLERHGDPRDRAEFAARAFLGLRLGCARCHDHPLDRWRQPDHLGLSALLATRLGPDGRIEPGNCYDDAGQPVTPRLLPLAGEPPAGLDAYGQFRWLALQGSDAFARTISNRLLQVLLGSAPVLPVDDHRASNPPHFGGLLDAVVAEFQRTDGDLRAMVRLIVTSAVYAADSTPLTADPERDALLAQHLGRASARTLRPCTWRRAVLTVLGLPRDRASASASASPSANANAAASATSPLAERLQAENGAFLAAALADPACLPALAASESDALTALFLRAFARPPTAAERTALTDPAAPAANLAQLAEAILLSREFGSRR